MLTKVELWINCLDVVDFFLDVFVQAYQDMVISVFQLHHHFEEDNPPMFI